jgi:Haem-binding domain
MKKWIVRVGMVLLVGLVAIQFVPVERTNPPVESDVPAAPELKAVLRRSCYDCHSNETRWPWYSYVAPISFWMAKDVREGRREVNFSVWNQFTGSRRARKFKEIVEQVEQGKMPQWYYVLVHPDAKLTVDNKEMIIQWAKRP